MDISALVFSLQPLDFGLPEYVIYLYKNIPW
jgi:hypothetical protein